MTPSSEQLSQSLSLRVARHSLPPPWDNTGKEISSLFWGVTSLPVHLLEQAGQSCSSRVNVLMWLWIPHGRLRRHSF